MPINAGGQVTIPSTVEVLPVCPSQLIIGTNWLNLAKAHIKFRDKYHHGSVQTRKSRNSGFLFQESQYVKENPLILH